MDHDRLEKQVQFIIEIDRLKNIARQTILMDRSRRENDAEHSWHIAVMALLLFEYSKDKNIDICRVVKMILIHDLVEIDAGDTYCYDPEAVNDQTEREEKAADRIFNILPGDQAKELRALWNEFERGNTPESRFAAALDRLQPLLHNYNTEGFMWKKHNIKKTQVITRNRRIEEGAPVLWKYASALIDDAVNRGYLDE
jgi:putative hydrolase of HD superfamily